MKLAWASLIAAALVLSAQGAAAQTQGAAAQAKTETFEADYVNPSLAPSHWTLELHPDGSGHFSSHGGDMGASGSDLKAPPVNRDIQVSREFAERVFQVAYRNKLFNIQCASHLKVAFQGTKTFRYTGPRGRGSCSFNYSRHKQIQSLGDSMIAVEQTIMEGARLELLLKHDPLGLDREMNFLVEAAKSGRAQQICVIKGILVQLAGDPQVLDRVRKWADELLQHPNS